MTLAGPSTDPALGALRRALGEISDLSAASALLHWDQETGMPRGAVEGRATVIATLAGLVHGRLVAPDLRRALDALEGAAEHSDDERALLRVTRRDVERATRLDAGLVEEIAAAASRAQAAWADARANDRFRDFEPHLERLLALKLRAAEQIGFGGHPLDAFLDDFEPGATVASLEPLLARLEAALAPLVAQVAASAVVLDPSPLLRPVPEAVQRAFACEVATAMGFDFERGRLDLSTHPFCTTIHQGDVRLTWRALPSDLKPGLFGVIHEAGHGLYEQGLPAAWSRTPLCDAASLGVHESQSRLWENMVARGRPFWTFFLPRLQALCPGTFDDLDVDAVVRAANVVRPSPIRVEADELTYSLHVVLRFRIECDLFAGRLAVSDVPAAWNAEHERLLGFRPASDAEGCLQDIHWSMGAFGYFPTYVLGNLYAAQLLEAARAALEDLGDLDRAIARGDLAPLAGWLRREVHSRGRSLDPAALLERATGAPPSERAFLDYVGRKYGELYRLG